MNILMLTNTFTPHVGGVARSVETFTAGYRALGHRVLVLAPRFEGMPESERDVIRVPAIQHFNGSDFSVPFPVPGLLAGVVERFRPDIVHLHHPYLLGGTALRIGASRNIPVVFTHHASGVHEMVRDRYNGRLLCWEAVEEFVAALYETLVSVGPAEKRLEGSLWATARRRLEEEWKIFKNLAAAAGGAWLGVGGAREGREAERAG